MQVSLLYRPVSFPSRDAADLLTGWQPRLTHKLCAPGVDAKSPSKAAGVPQSVALNLEKLRQSVMALREANGGSFNSINPSELIPTPWARRKSTTSEHGISAPAASPSWRISAKSSGKDVPSLAGPISPLPTPRRRSTPLSGNSSTQQTPRMRSVSPLKPPTSASRRMPDVSPFTPRRDAPVRLPTQVRNNNVEDEWDQHLEALNELTEKLSLTASEIPKEKIVERKVYSTSSKPKRPDHWHKYHDLAEKLEEAKVQLETLYCGQKAKQSHHRGRNSA